MVGKDLPNKLALPFEQAMKRVQDAARDALREQEGLFAQLENRAVRLFMDTRTAAEMYEIKLRELNQVQSAGLIDTETYERAYASLRAELERSSVSIEQVKESAAEVSVEFDNFARIGAANVFQVFTDQLFNPMDRSFKQMAANFALTLARMAAQAAQQRIIQAIIGGVAGGATGGGGGGGAGQVVGAVASVGLGAATQTRTSALEHHGATGMGANATASRSQALTEQGDTNIINVLDPSLVEQYLLSAAGKRAIINVMQSTRQVMA